MAQEHLTWCCSAGLMPQACRGQIYVLILFETMDQWLNYQPYHSISQCDRASISSMDLQRHFWTDLIIFEMFVQCLFTECPVLVLLCWMYCFFFIMWLTRWCSMILFSCVCCHYKSFFVCCCYHMFWYIISFVFAWYLGGCFVVLCLVSAVLLLSLLLLYFPMASLVL